MNLLWQKRIVFLLIAIAALLWVWGINYPFVGLYNANNNYLSLAAKNYIRFGFWNLKLFPTYFAGEYFITGTPHYLHHPFLIFLTEAFFVSLFGTAHWVIHAPQLLFTAGSMGMIYVIAKKIWNLNVALWSLGLAVIFPMTGFFWKFMQYEQASLLVNLALYYVFVCYIKKQKSRYLIAIFFLAVLSGCIDWGVLYLIFPFTILFFSKFRNIIKPVLIVYLLGTGISIGAFLIGVLSVQNGIKELYPAIWGWTYTSQLTGLSFWPLRLGVISVIRIFLYFSPVAILSGIYILKRVTRKHIWDLSDMTILFFFIFGFLNFIFLPTATWGHSYFLYYFIPFFALAGGIWFQRFNTKPTALCFWVGIIIVTSSIVNYFKIQQVRKQLWKYDVAGEISRRLTPYETIGVVNFAGDVFENYFYHPTQPIPYTQLASWINDKSYPGVNKAVFVCMGSCSREEFRTIEQLQVSGQTETYYSGDNQAWVITKKDTGGQHIIPTNIQIPSGYPSSTAENIFLRWYRVIRDILNVGQI